jgi:D-glycero-D-manno-heptose 1,7-bisphosphate phosphatase
MTNGSPAVFLDRDNTLIDNDGDLGNPEQVRLLDGVASSLVRLRDAGFRLVVISNQGGVARGACTEADVEAVNTRIEEIIEHETGRPGLIDDFYSCPWHPEGTVERYRREHPWRKPQPGMLLAAQSDFDLDLHRSWFIGDQARDIAAGHAAGCATVLISKDAETIRAAEPTAVVETFPEAVDLILRNLRF